MSFTNQLKGAASYAYTQNGAIAFSTSGTPVLDLFSLGGAARQMSDKQIEELAMAAWAHNSLLALRCLFYLRDVRGGTGERRFFRVAMKYLLRLYQIAFLNALKLIPEYGRWDDFLEIAAENELFLVDFLATQLQQDSKNMHDNKPISLLAKWLPSINAGKTSRRQALKLCESLKISEKKYRLMLSQMRAYLKVVERKMCANQWNEIDYPQVPSQASRIYRNAFKKHDENRYQKFLNDVAEGKEKINAKTLFPYEILQSYGASPQGIHRSIDQTLEVLWKNLPDYCDGCTDNSLVMADTSGSMMGLPINISVSLAIYMAERNRGVFKDYFMTFSSRPQMVKLKGTTLHEKVNNIPCIVENTDIVAAFQMLLAFARNSKATQEEMPKTLYIISDMQFDENGGGNYQSTFHNLKAMYQALGYELPRIVFWNVNNAGGKQLPVQKDEVNTVLVSGSSPVIFKQVTAGKFLTPHEHMLSVLNSERYRAINLG